jgi:hypothetical protein
MRRYRRPPSREARLSWEAREVVDLLCDRLHQRHGEQPFTRDDLILVIRDLLWEGELEPDYVVSLIRLIKHDRSPLGQGPEFRGNLESINLLWATGPSSRDEERGVAWP